ncbi:MAG: hypothetical protein AB1779_05880 [Candidatus Thermoplasmatota archaeon]
MHRFSAIIVVLLLLPFSFGYDEEEPNNNISTGTWIEGNQTWNGSLSFSDQIDIYKINLTTGTTADKISINLTVNETGTIAIILRDPNMFYIGLDYANEGKKTSIVEKIASITGTYYIELLWIDGSQKYSLMVNITSSPFVSDENNAPSEALEVSSYPFTIQGKLDEINDSHDFYKMEIMQNESYQDIINIKATALSGTIHLLIHNSSIGSEENIIFWENISEKIEVEVGGSYVSAKTTYVRVWGITSGEYILNFTKRTMIFDNNNILANATKLSYNQKKNVFNYLKSDIVHETVDEFDYYSFYVWNNSAVDINLTILNYNETEKMPDINLLLYSPEEIEIASSTTNEKNERIIINIGKKGAYYVCVLAKKTGYSLTSYALYSLNITVKVTNFAPKMNKPIPSFSFNEDTYVPKFINLSEYFNDDHDDKLNYSISYNQDKTKIYADITENFINVNATTLNWTGTIRFKVAAADSMGESTESNNFTISVVQVNDKPAFLNISSLFLLEDENTTIDLYDVFYDAESSEQRKLQFYARGWKNIDTIIANDGFCTLIPKKDWFGFELITFYANDTEYNVSAEINVTVRNVNDPPRPYNPEVMINMTEDETSKIDLSKFFYDIDSTDIKIFVSTMKNIDVEVIGNNATFKTKKEHWFGTESTTVFADDGESRGSMLLTLNVLPENDAPDIVGFNPTSINYTINEGGKITFGVDARDVENDVLSYIWFINGHRQEEINSSYTFYASYQSAGTYEVKVLVSDGVLTDYFIWTLHVKDVNRPPTSLQIFFPEEGKKYKDDEKVFFSASATDPDFDNLTYIWLENGFQIAEGKEAYVLLSKGTHVITLVVSDRKGESARQTITVVVEEVKKPEKLDIYFYLGIFGFILLIVALACGIYYTSLIKKKKAILEKIEERERREKVTELPVSEAMIKPEEVKISIPGIDTEVLTPVVTSEAVLCSYCNKEIAFDVMAFRCVCETSYHEECVKKLENCPNCTKKWKV